MDRSRFDRWLPEMAMKEVRVGLVGVGTINGWLALSLARMGVGYFWLCDPDVVGEENRSTQPWLSRHVGMGKAEAMKEIIYEIDPEIEVEITMTPIPKVLGEIPLLDFFIAGTDNYQSRRELAKWWHEENRKEILIDHRMGLTSYECNVVPGGHGYEGEYLKTITEDKDYSEDVCGEKAIAFTGCTLRQGCRVWLHPSSGVGRQRRRHREGGGWRS